MDSRVNSIKSVIENFLSELEEKYTPPEIERILRGERTLTGGDLGSSPESFTEETLIWDILEVLELERSPGRPVDSETKEPDFRINNFEDIQIIGENKPVRNSVEQAESELVGEYLSRMAWPKNGIATDGFEWRLYKAQKIGDTVEFPRLDDGEGDLTQVIFQIAREQEIIPSQQISEVDVEEKLNEFISKFEKQSLEKLFGEEAPKEFRDERKNDIDEFFQLYIELLFGEGNKHDYEINLLNEITAPQDASEEDKRMFAVTLMNRLLFVKFLESREILPEGFLRQRVTDYEEIGDRLPNNMYDSMMDPLFYDLLGDDEREEGGDGWQQEVPYLNGGLFREKLENEREYTVSDRILPTIVDDLIEGSELSKNGESFDPGLLGSVFEKTINHLEADKTQKDIGAFYTPSDVTDLIVEQSVDPKLKEVIIESTIEVFGENMEQSIRDELEPKEIPEILRMMESQESYFGNADIADEILEEVQNLNILDPACGSGHFLTSAMDEVHQVQLSALLNLNRGEEPSREEKFKAKRDIALSCIYGVDVDEIATEIAMLRVWLKIVEENGWEEEFGKLPNIDVNISAGNSLIGFPIIGNSQAAFDIANDQLEKLEKLRKNYKDDLIDKEKLDDKKEEVQETLNRQYLKFHKNYVETEINTPEEFESLRSSVEEEEINSIFNEVKVEREDGDALTEADKNFLERKGFAWQEWRDTNKSAKLTIQERWNKLGSEQNGERNTQIFEELKEILENHFEFTEVERRPVEADLKEILGQPFHWGAEFPETLKEKDLKTGSALNFDIVLGNPPYGDILPEESEILTESYRTGDVKEVSAQFKERQIQLLEEDGYFGNITTLKIMYDDSMKTVRDILREKLDSAKIANFSTGPSQVFENAEVRVSIINGRKDSSDEAPIKTSKYLRFHSDERSEVMQNIDYESTENLGLGDRIGSDDTVSLPKVGKTEIKGVLEKLRDNFNRRIIEAGNRDSESEHPVWRKRGPRYWINPYLENLYGNDTPDSFDPIYFEDEIDRRFTFLTLQSSLFYLFWITYGDERHLNWSQIEPFPLPQKESLEEREEEIKSLSEELWCEMREIFERNGQMEGISDLRSLIDDIDELVGELYGFNMEEIEYLKQYDAEYGRGE